MVLVEQLPVHTYLQRRGIFFETVPHVTTETAMAEARALSLPGETVLKAVVLRTDEGFAMAILPASRRIDMNLVMQSVTDPRVRLATEEEIASAFPGYELGAFPPIPDVLGIPGFVDPTVFDNEEAAFADGLRTESLIANVRELFWGQDVTVVPISMPYEVHPVWDLNGWG